MELYPFKKAYDWVTVLSGVNNQYRGHSIESYKKEFNQLLNRALELAEGYSHHLIVLSIPDWGCTPFAHDRDTAKISLEIDLFNSENKQMAEERKMHYVDICTGSRLSKDHPELVAADGLHPSSDEYARWAKLLATIIRSQP
jgi:lysophospholipase L1-like esterase